MAIKFPRVQPGDLITSNFMNSILDELEALEAKIGIVSSTPSKTVSITGLIPSGTVRVGDELRVVGTGFGFPAFNVVTIDGVRLDGPQFKAGSTDTLLIFDVPGIPGLPPTGKVATLVVSNLNGAASTTFSLLPFQPTIPAGRIFISLSKSPPGSLTPPGSYDFEFSIQADTNMDERYLVTPTIDLNGWSATAFNMSNVPIAEIPINKGKTETIKVNVGIPSTAGTDTAKLTLAVASKNNPGGLNKSRDFPLKSGGQPPTPAKGVVVNAVGGTPPVLEVPPDGVTIVELDLNAQITNVGNNQKYNMVTTFDNAAGWTIAGVDPVSPFTVNVPANGKADVALTINLKAGGTATATNLKVNVTNANDNTITSGDVLQKIRPKP